MKRAIALAAIVWMAAGHAAYGQGDVNRVLADARAALGGEKKLGALKTVAARGQSVRVTEAGSSAPADVEMAFELPGKFMKTDVVAVINGTAVTRTSGFNGDNVIEIVDRPPAMSGANIVLRFGGPDEGDGKPLTPEQQDAQHKARLLAARQDFARIVLGVLLSSPAAYPLDFSYGGQAESPDGKADIVDVKGEGDFAVRLFIDTKSHLPLMLSWMGRAPMIIKRTVGGPGGRAGTPPARMTPDQMEKMAGELKAAEARQPVVEYRLYYGDYRDVDGVKFPFSLQRSIDGKPAEQVTFEKVTINGKLDPKKFDAR